MPTPLDPKKLQKSMHQGFKRLENARRSRLMFLRAYTGQYFDADKGLIGSEPLNLIFNAIRVLIPNLVFNFPKHAVSSQFIAHRDYADMLGLALSFQDKQLNMRDVYRRAIIDAIFFRGIVKTGLADSGTVIGFDETDQIDPGTVYTENVDLDNYVFDPNARNINEALYVGDRIRIPRQQLLDSGLYDNDAIMRLPRAGSGEGFRDRAEGLSANGINLQEVGELTDDVEICELWVPQAKALITVPGDCEYTADDYLRVADYYGPDRGPYTYLDLTPPVPNNPLPIAMVGIWYDLHVMANRMVKKIIQQAERQKSLVGYKRAAADDAQELLDAEDGEAVAMDDPEGVKAYNFGGQQQSNEIHVQQLQQWFNMMAGNPEGMAGLSMNAKSATEANMLQSNAQTTLEDMKDMVYGFVAEEASKRAWYLHTDPLIEIPLTRRIEVPGQYAQGPAGPVVISPPRTEEVQVTLTPEARRGDFLQFHFSIEPESMGRVDSKVRLERALNFAVKVVPAAAQAAQTATMMGVPFSFSKYVLNMAKEVGITWMEEVFNDPEFQMKMMMLAARGPQAEGSKGSAGSPAGDGGIAQNGQPGQVGAVAGADEQARSYAQQGSAEAQGELPVRPMY